MQCYYVFYKIYYKVKPFSKSCIKLVSKLSVTDVMRFRYKTNIIRIILASKIFLTSKYNLAGSVFELRQLSVTGDDVVTNLFERFFTHEKIRITVYIFYLATVIFKKNTFSEFPKMHAKNKLLALTSNWKNVRKFFVDTKSYVNSVYPIVSFCVWKYF